MINLWALKLGNTYKIIEQIHMSICNLTTDLFCTRYSNVKMLTCCGALWPFGTANTSWSRGMSLDGHSDRMKVLVIPAFPFLTEAEKKKNTSISTWSNMDCVSTTFGMIIDQSANSNWIAASHHQWQISTTAANQQKYVTIHVRLVILF